jgi:hypothetical protein
VRSHDLTASDLRPIYIGTGTNVGGGVPPLISPEALGLGGTGAAGPGGPAQQAAPALQPPGAPVTTAPGAAAPAPEAPPRAPGIVPIQPVPSGAATPAPAGAGTRIEIAPPAAGPEGTLPVGGGPYTMPIQITGASNIAAVSLTITYNPSVLTTPRVGQGSFMAQGGVTPTFADNIAESAGRIEMAFSRPPNQPGASGSGLVGAISFGTLAAGNSDVIISGVATTTAGQSVPLQFGSTRVTVK